MSEQAKATSEVVRSGFFYGLAGAAVRKDDENGDRRVVGGRFTVATTVKGKHTVLADWANIEAPYPMTDEAAAEAAADCRTTLYKLDSNGDVQAVKLTGLPAAVSIALAGRRDEAFRGKVRGRKITGRDQLQTAMLETYGFQLDRVEATVSREQLAAILMDDDATPQERQEALEALLAAGGMTVR